MPYAMRNTIANWPALRLLAEAAGVALVLAGPVLAAWLLLRCHD